MSIVLVAACSTKEVEGTDPTGGGGSIGGGVDCATECRTAHPEGADLFDKLGLCLICHECYADCDGEGEGCNQPPFLGLCDNKNVCDDNDMDPSDDCTGCALAGPCKDELEACQDKPDCVLFLQCLQPC